eukprot:6473243-Pyramimonas_sp.AAC.1
MRASNSARLLDCLGPGRFPAWPLMGPIWFQLGSLHHAARWVNAHPHLRRRGSLVWAPPEPSPAPQNW